MCPRSGRPHCTATSVASYGFKGRCGDGFKSWVGLAVLVDGETPLHRKARRGTDAFSDLVTLADLSGRTSVVHSPQRGPVEPERNLSLLVEEEETTAKSRS